mgnify:CR=1 FL=1
MKLKEGDSFIIADGREYLHPEALQLPQGSAALLCDGNSPQREQNEDAIGVVRVRDLVFGAIADGMSCFQNSGALASQYVRSSLECAEADWKAGRKVRPPQVNRRVLRSVRQTHLKEGKPEISGTVGCFFVLDPHGVLVVSRFGDPEFAQATRRNGETVLNLGCSPKLLPQNVALEKFGKKPEMDLWGVLRPQTRDDRRVTHYLKSNGDKQRMAWDSASIQL